MHGESLIGGVGETLQYQFLPERGSVHSGESTGDSSGVQAAYSALRRAN